MKVCLEWLNAIIDVKDIPLKTLEDRLIMSGSKVETTEQMGKDVKNVVVGRVLSVEKHPEADRLVVCQVDIGAKTVQIVTGATNVFAEALVPVALVGAELPGGKQIGLTEFRGLPSEGMLCSLDELGFEDSVVPKKYSDGILILNDDLQLGMNIVDALSLDDAVIEFEITPNRPDCLSMMGMAREASATFDRPFEYTNTDVSKAVDKIDGLAAVEVNDTELCPRFGVRVIKEVTIKESPLWLQMRLMKSGMRPINNIVDITNYVMLEYGQPIHAYDLNDIKGRKLIVRRAQPGETLKTLDDKVRVLDETMLLITDDEKPLGIAGIMGGEAGEVREQTTDILIEVANFNKSSIRETSKRLGLRTEASSRFEKGIDPNAVETVLNRVCHLIEQLDAGTVIQGMIDVYPKPVEAITVKARIDRINNLIGIQLTGEEMKNLLNRLEMKTQVVSEMIHIQIPTFRLDVLKEIDIVEEVARLYGYDRIPATLPRDESWGAFSKSQTIENITKTALVAEGYKEICTYTFISPRAYDRIRLPESSPLRQVIQVRNPLGEEYSVMRTSLLPSALEVLERNYKKDVQHAEVFEIGTLFFPNELPVTTLPTEKKGLIMGLMGEHYSFSILKGALTHYFERLGIKNVTYIPEMNHPTYHPGRCATLVSDGAVLGIVGEIHPLVSENYGIKTTVLCAELDLSLLIEIAKLDTLYKPLPKYPSSRRDIAMLIDDEILASTVEETIKKHASSLLEQCQVFDVYKGKQVPEGKKSMAYALTFRAVDHTMTEDEITHAYRSVLDGLVQDLKVELR